MAKKRMQASSLSLTMSDFGLFGQLGNIDAYISAVNRLPMLTAEEEIQYANAFREHNDLESAQKLVLSHLRLVVSIARGYLGYGLLHSDLIQEGNIGLMKAVKRFDERKNVRLVSYALHWIKAEIHEYILKNWRLVKGATTKAQRKLFFNPRSYKDNNDSLSSMQIEKIAKDLNVKASDVKEMEVRLGGGDIALEPLNDTEDEQFAPITYLSSDREEPSRVIQTRYNDMLQSEGLALALEKLDSRSRRIVEARWLVDDDKESSTLHDLAKEFGISAERIRQIEVVALKKMKGSLLTYRPSLPTAI